MTINYLIISKSISLYKLNINLYFNYLKFNYL